MRGTETRADLGTRPGCYSAASAAGARPALRSADPRAVPQHSTLSSSITATSTSTSSGWPRSIRNPHGTGVTAEPERQPGADEPEHLADLPGRCRVLQHDIAWRAAGTECEAGREHQRDHRQVRQASQFTARTSTADAIVSTAANTMTWRL